MFGFGSAFCCLLVAVWVIFLLFSIIMCKKAVFCLKSVDYCCINKCIIHENIRIFALYYEVRYFVLVE